MRGPSVLLSIALLSVALLAGCADEKKTDETVDEPPAEQPADSGLDASGAVAAYPGMAPVFAQRAVSNSDRTAGEPTIAPSITGCTVYPSIAFDSMVGAPGVTSLALTRVYATQDEGLTWTDVSPKTPAGDVDTQIQSLDPYVYAEPVTGRIYTMDLNLAYGGILSWTDDCGATWTTQPGCCGIPGPNDHQTLFSGPATTIPAPLYQDRILYFCVNQVYDAVCSHSLDGGLTWSVSGAPAYRDPVRPQDGLATGVCGSLHGHGHASKVTGTVFLPKVHCGVPTVAVSRDNGLTWVDGEGQPGFTVVNRTIGGTGHEAIVSTDSAGNVYYFWLDRNGFARLSVSHDDGTTWGPAINVTAPGVTALGFPSIVAGDEGRIAFLYLGSEVPGGWQADETDMHNATWNAYIGYSLNAHEDNPVFVTVTANDPADPLNRGPCGGRCQPPEGGGMYDFLDIDINAATGQVYVALVDNCRDACAGPDGTAEMQTTGTGAIGVQVGGTDLVADETDAAAAPPPGRRD